MKNNRIRLTESQLHNVIRHSVNKVLSEEHIYEDHGEELLNKMLSAMKEFLDYDEIASRENGLDMPDELHEVVQDAMDTITSLAYSSD